MITDLGKKTIKNYFGGQVPRIGGSIALGIGNAAESASNTALNYEVARAIVTSVNADLANDRIIFKATFLPTDIGTIYEIGLFSDVILNTRRRMLSITEFTRSVWNNASIVTNNARAGRKTVQVAVAAGGTKNAEIGNLSQNFSEYVGTDSLAVGFYATSTLSSLRIRLGANADNYYEFVFSPTSGYNILRANLSSATVTGNPSWSDVNYLALRPSATSAGSASVYLDAMAIEDNTTDNQDNLLVIRNVLATPQPTDFSLNTDVELSLGVSV
jgi:hypothetical protein